MIDIGAFIVVGVLLFCIGFAGVLFWQDVLIMLMSIEIMLNGANLVLVAFSARWGEMGGQVLALFVMLVTAAEVAVALSLTYLIFHRKESLDTSLFDRLRR